MKRLNLCQAIVIAAAVGVMAFSQVSYAQRGIKVEGTKGKEVDKRAKDFENMKDERARRERLVEVIRASGIKDLISRLNESESAKRASQEGGRGGSETLGRGRSEDEVIKRALEKVESERYGLNTLNNLLIAVEFEPNTKTQEVARKLIADALFVIANVEGQKTISIEGVYDMLSRNLALAEDVTNLGELAKDRASFESLDGLKALAEFYAGLRAEVQKDLVEKTAGNRRSLEEIVDAYLATRSLKDKREEFLRCFLG